MTLIPRPQDDSLEARARAADALHAQLTDLLRFFPSYNLQPLSGRKVFRHHAAIFWPDFLAAMRRSTVWRDRFCPQAQLDQDRRNRGVPRSGPAHVAWFAKALRRHVEGLLAPLRIPVSSSVGANAKVYAYDVRGYGEDRINDVNPEAWAALNEDANYTYFKRVAVRPNVLQRVLVLPPDFEKFQRSQAAVPEEIVALYYAWRAVTTRPADLYDPRTTGVEWTDQGLLFVNWTRFLGSPLRPPVNIGPGNCALFLRGGHRQGKYRLRLSAFPDPLKFKTLPEETEAVDEADFLAVAESYSLIDPLYLVDRPELFDATYHTSRMRRQKQSKAKTVARIKQRREYRKLTGEDLPTKARRLSKVHVFPFRPYEHVPSQFQESPQLLSFGEYEDIREYQENVFAVSFKGQLYFAEPALLRILVKTAPNEVDAWKRAMDRLSFVAQFAVSGDITKVVPKNKKSVMQDLQREQLQRVAADMIDNFLSLDELTNAQRQRVKRESARRLGESTSTAVEGSRWYHDTLLNLTRHSLPLSVVRREAYCLLPGRNDDAPMSHIFYSPHTLKQFLQEAKGVVVPLGGGLPDADEVAPAPYIYAWASFCLNAARFGLSYAIKEPGRNNHWTPPEDLQLVRFYRRYPVLKRKERALLMERLPNHSWKAMISRIHFLNELLRCLLSAPRRKRYTLGKLWLDGADLDAEAMRLVVLIGIGLNRRYQNEPVHAALPCVNDAFQLSAESLKALPLPNTYRSDQFEILAKG